MTTSDQLAHVAFNEARIAVQNIINEKKYKIDYTAVPHCIWTSPEIASVGLNEKQARKRYENIRVTKYPFYANGKALIKGHSEGYIKLIANNQNERILGISIIGGNATELIAEASLILSKKMTVKDVINTIHPHPTLSEVMSEVSLASIGLNLHSV